MSTGRLIEWVIAHAFNIVVILVGATILVRTSRLLISRLQHRVGYGHVDRDLEWQRRASTLGGILIRLVTVTVWFVAILMLLRELAIDVMPILTGAGIVGLAIGFGAQNLVRDVISGFFLILEDQVRVGDIARINGVPGVIEHVNLRTLVLRDNEGAVHVFPNGTVTALANLSKQFSNAIVEIRVRYTENMENVFDAIRQVGESMQSDPQWGSLLLAPIEVLGVESIADGAATVKAKFKTQPLDQSKVANEVRRRVLKAFVERRIKFAGVQPPVTSSEPRPANSEPPAPSPEPRE